LIVAFTWVAACRGEGSPQSADLNDDGIVDSRDLLQVAGQWRRTSSYSGGQLPFGLTRYPYIQKTTDKSFLVAWRTKEQVAGSVEYGTSESLGSSVSIPDATTVHAITVSDLVADATYYYRVTGDGSPLTPIETTRTFPVPGTDQAFSFAVLGDSGDGSHHQFNVAYELEQLPVDFVVHTGDVVYLRGEAKYYEDRFFLPYMNTLKRIPVFPCLGNHDEMTDLGAPYLDNFYLPENSPEEPERYYSFDYGDAHFTVLEGGYGANDYLPTSSEYEWLAEDLSAAASSQWRFVVLHYAPYNSEILHYADSLIPNLRKYWVPLFEAYGVHVVFTGHCHYYERSIPLTGGNPDPADGVMYVISGGGGGVVRESIGFDQCPKCFLRSAYRASRHHLLKVDVNGFRLTVNAIDEHGEVFDRLYLMQNEDLSTKWVSHF
jgi:hypothetical protein